jgi:hypothetical protein
MINLAIEANKNNDYFPIWGTCLGLEVILMALSNDYNILDINLNDNNTRHSL